jgi:tRNA (Thr-GGU) A37 N-methylase
LGSTICRILKVEGRRLFVEGLDAVDGTPVLDLKPWVHEFAPRGPTYQPNWITELMSEYWKKS